MYFWKNKKRSCLNIMDDKILLITHSRSGSTYFTDLFNNVQKNKNPNFLPCIAEPHARIDLSDWSLHIKKVMCSKNKLENGSIAELQKYVIKVLNLNSFILKYNIHHYNHIIIHEKIIELCIKNNISVYFLYRKNLLDQCLSKIISKHTNIWNTNNKNYKKINYENIVFEDDILYEIILHNTYALYNSHFTNRLFRNSNINTTVYTYEDNVLSSNMPFPTLELNHIPHKLNSKQDSNIVLNNNPKIYEYLKQCCDKFNIEYDNEYNFVSIKNYNFAQSLQ